MRRRASKAMATASEEEVFYDEIDTDDEREPLSPLLAKTELEIQELSKADLYDECPAHKEKKPAKQQVNFMIVHALDEGGDGYPKGAPLTLTMSKRRSRRRGRRRADALY